LLTLAIVAGQAREPESQGPILRASLTAIAVVSVAGAVATLAQGIWQSLFPFHRPWPPRLRVPVRALRDGTVGSTRLGRGEVLRPYREAAGAWVIEGNVAFVRPWDRWIAQYRAWRKKRRENPYT
jgi:hypothetical protein